MAQACSVDVFSDQGCLDRFNPLWFTYRYFVMHAHERESKQIRGQTSDNVLVKCQA